MAIVLFYLSIFGACLCVSLLSIGSPIRDFIDRHFSLPAAPQDSENQPQALSKIQVFVRCPACLGFWIAAVFSVAVFSPALDSGLCRARILASVLDGLVAVAVNWVAHVALTRMGQYDL